MSDEASEVSGQPEDAELLHGAVVVGVVPDLNPRVLKEAARYAQLLAAPLVVTHVDVTRFVTY
jgi:K+-sensing histidine kinase KdpD